jgi:phosphoglycolate phosphatase
VALVVFDLDGVLIDSREANYQAFAEGLKAVGLQAPEPPSVIRLIGRSAQEMLRILGCPSDRVDEVFTQVVQPYYLAHLERLARPVEGAAAVLQELRQRGHRLAACTSGDRRTQLRALQMMDLWHYFEDMQTPDDSRHRKPEVEFLQEQIQRLGYEGPVLHVEDSPVGLEMGLRWGATTVFADYGFGRPEPWQPHFRIADLPQLLQIAEVWDRNPA